MGRDIYRWHVTVSAMAWALGVDPFNQPDVQGAKENLFAELAHPGTSVESLSVDADLLEAATAADYVALQVFGPLSIDREIELLRQTLSRRFQHVTGSLGPRFLHSCGQLQKGGPRGVVALQVIVEPTSEPQRISGRHYSFHDLHIAQARADAAALRAAGRKVIQLRVQHLDEVVGRLDLGPTMGR